MASIPHLNQANPKNQTRRKDHKSRIEVHLNPKPADYVPGSGPPSQPLRLIPPRDSTGYIQERILLPSPGPAADGRPLPKRMTYIVGFHDLPAACLLVPAMDVLDYVSPLALEEWEWQMELELDEERERLAQKATKEVAPSKRQGRAPAHSQIEPAIVVEPETEAKGQLGKGAMSLTTPTKPRLEDFEGLSEEEASPTRQLEREMIEAINVDTDDVLDDYEIADSEHGKPPLRDVVEAYKPQTQQPGTLGLEDSGTSSQKYVSKMHSDSLLSTQTSCQRSTPKPALPKQHMQTNPKKRTFSSLPEDKLPFTPVSVATVERPLHQISFTPAGRSAAFRASKSSTPNTPGDIPATTPNAQTMATRAKPKAPAKKAKMEGSKPSVGEDGEPVWEVKRLEEMQLYEVEGAGLVRYFKVLWKGDWPPDQNPSWEPEQNLPANLVRKFMKRSNKKATSQATKKRKSLKQATLPWAEVAHYKTVSDAFAGDHGNATMTNGPLEDWNGRIIDDSDGQDELLVVEEPAEMTNSQPSWVGDSEISGRGLLPMYG